MFKKIKTITAALLAGTMMAGCGMAASPAALLEKASNELSYLDEDNELIVKGTLTLPQGTSIFSGREVPFEYSLNAPVQETGDHAAMAGKVTKTEYMQEQSDDTFVYVENGLTAEGEEENTLYIQIEGVWTGYHTTGKVSEIDYVKALLNKETYEQISVGKTADDEKIVLEGLIRGDIMLPLMAKSLSFSDIFCRTASMSTVYGKPEYHVYIYFDKKTQELLKLEVFADPVESDIAKMETFHQKITFQNETAKMEEKTLTVSDGVKESAYINEAGFADYLTKPVEVGEFDLSE